MADHGRLSVMPISARECPVLVQREKIDVRLLLVEDDEQLGQGIRKALMRDGDHVDWIAIQTIQFGVVAQRPLVPGQHAEPP